jgi:glyoxylase-like metal-dependent hydrolase (beta-lactamase superfamily II)
MLPEQGVILDAGTAFYRVRDRIATDSLDVFLTHTHLDHVIGLTFVFDVLWGHEDVTVRVHGTPDVLAALQDHLFSEPLFLSCRRSNGCRWPMKSCCATARGSRTFP